MTGPTGSIFTLRSRYNLVPSEYFGTYVFSDDARFKPHWLVLQEQMFQCDVTPMNRLSVVWLKYVMPKLEEMFGSAGPSNDYKWNTRVSDEITLMFRSKSDLTYFMLWFKGQNSDTIQDG